VPEREGERRLPEQGSSGGVQCGSFSAPPPSRMIESRQPYRGHTMPSGTTKLTIRLPREHVEFLKVRARAHGLTATEVIDRYLRRLQALRGREPGAEVAAISPLVPADVDVEGAYRAHLLDEHGR
jgi:hypothetical protein